MDARIQRAAAELFLEHGFDATTMEAIAKAAGVTKRTLYLRHGSKRELFVTTIAWAIARLRYEEPSCEPEDDLVGGLTRIARSALAWSIDPTITRLIQLVRSGSARFPELATSIAAMTFAPRIEEAAALLRHHVAAGTIVLDDVDIAAEQFIAMVVALPAHLASLGIHRPQQVEERHIQRAIDFFLLAARPR